MISLASHVVYVVKQCPQLNMDKLKTSHNHNTFYKRKEILWYKLTSGSIGHPMFSSKQA